MTIKVLKTQMVEAINQINDDFFLEAINNLLQQKSNEKAFRFSKNEIKELEKMRKNRLEGKDKWLTEKEMKGHLRKLRIK